MGSLLPPGPNQAELELELSLVPARHREDAAQEAWIAHLEGRDPLKAIWTHSKREQRHEQGRAEIGTDDEGQPIAIDTDGSIQNLPAPQQSKPVSAHPRHNSLARAG